jgi:hypothetical protein
MDYQKYKETKDRLLNELEQLKADYAGLAVGSKVIPDQGAFKGHVCYVTEIIVHEFDDALTGQLTISFRKAKKDETPATRGAEQSFLLNPLSIKDYFTILLA